MKKNYKAAVCLVTLVSAVALVFLICNAIVSVRKQTEAHCFTYLDEATARLADDLYKMTDMDRTVLGAMASLIAVEDTPTNNSLCAVMNSYSGDTTYVNYIELLRPDNTMLDADGTTRDVSGLLDFNEEAKKGVYVSDIEFSTQEPTERIIRNAVPVQKDGQTIFMLYGVVRLLDFEKAYTTNIYNGDAYVYLVDGNTGDFMLDTWHSSFGNISDFFDRKTISGDTFQDAVVKIKNGKSGDMAFVSHTTGDTLYMHYEPVGINNWSVFVTVQDHYALKNSNEINNTLFKMAAECGMIAFCYMLFVTLTLLGAYRRIRKLGMSDRVTGLQNRNAYDAYLSMNQDKTFALISCVFVDANGLHELNNLKGHDAGDQMLRCVAETLLASFKTHCIFRTGGDEFVAIIENMDETACTACTELMNERITAEGYSVAYGAVTQQNATDIASLASIADARMIANKKLYYATHDRRMR